MIKEVQLIDSAQSMISAIRKLGIVPLFHNPVKGWSIEELTAPGYWFTESNDGELGPWDWKIDAVREGDILYGKFISNKAAFATTYWYRHLMNWRRSLPRMRMALGESYNATNQMDLLAKHLSPTLLSEIRNSHLIESSRVKTILSERIPEDVRMKIGGSMKKYLFPSVKKTACDYVLQFLDMGTWTVIGDFERVYRGPNLEYKGWQRSTITIPEEILDTDSITEDTPSWALRFTEEQNSFPDIEDHYSPTDSRNLIIEHVAAISGCKNVETVRKFISAHI